MFNQVCMIEEEQKVSPHKNHSSGKITYAQRAARFHKSILVLLRAPANRIPIIQST
jgi:hypothetical protein